MLRSEIRQVLGVDLPIEGGNGTSLEEAIVIRKRKGHDIYSVESAVLKYLYERYCLAQELVKQELLSREGRIYDRFVSFCQYKENKPDEIDLVNVYFDITDCWNRKAKPGKQQNS